MLHRVSKSSNTNSNLILLALKAVDILFERLFLDFEKFSLLCQNLRMHMFYIPILSEH